MMTFVTFSHLGLWTRLWSVITMLKFLPAYFIVKHVFYVGISEECIVISSCMWRFLGIEPMILLRCNALKNTQKRPFLHLIEILNMKKIVNCIALRPFLHFKYITLNWIQCNSPFIFHIIWYAIHILVFMSINWEGNAFHMFVTH